MALCWVPRLSKTTSLSFGSAMWGKDWGRISRVIKAAEHIESAEDMRWYIGNHIADYLGEDATEREKEFSKDRFLFDCGLTETDTNTHSQEEN